ncbi:MAG TPA: CPBP family intramembrane glutamic endopeptidase [Gemmataceae bacterium]|jgi:membrane protease YdiL (CAAX protease family)
MLIRLWKRWFGGPLRQIEANSLTYRLSEAGQGLDRKTVAVVLIAAACLTTQNYCDSPERLVPLCGFVAERISGPTAREEVTATLEGWNKHQSTRLPWFGLCAILTYTLMPALTIKLFFRERLLDYGLGIRGVIADWPVYASFAVIMVPLVVLFSAEERFQAVYPFYRIHSRDEIGPLFYRWEAIYACQFMALEFFFRGFIVHGVKHRFGAYAVFVMVIPYCMIHFHKPWPEACGSVLAGVGLGVVSLVTKSIWPGAALHITVAWGMDFSSLWRRGFLG